MPPKDNKDSNKVAPKTFEQFLELPSDVMERVVGFASSTLILAKLARTSKAMHNLVQPELDKRAAKQLLEYVLKPTEDNIAKAKKMYEANPKLIFIEVEDEVEEYAAGTTTRINDAGVEEHVAVHRRVKGLSPFRAA